MTPETLQLAGLAADLIGVAVDALAAPISSLPAPPGGLGVGATMEDMAPAWTTLLRALGNQVAQVGSRLLTTSDNYQRQENYVAGSFRRIAAP